MRELREADEVGWRLLRAVPVPLVAVASTGRIGFINESAERLFGWSEDDLLGETVQALVPGSTGSSTDLQPGPVSARRNDGRTFPAEIDVGVVADGTPELAVLVTVRDLSQGAEREQQRQREGVGIAHDYNNLLGVILNYATLAGRAVSDPQVTADIAEIRAAAERAAELTRRLLAFARQEPLDPEPLGA